MAQDYYNESGLNTALQGGAGGTHKELTKSQDGRSITVGDAIYWDNHEDAAKKGISNSATGVDLEVGGRLDACDANMRPAIVELADGTRYIIGNKDLLNRGDEYTDAGTRWAPIIWKLEDDGSMPHISTSTSSQLSNVGAKIRHVTATLIDGGDKIAIAQWLSGTSVFYVATSVYNITTGIWAYGGLHGNSWSAPEAATGGFMKTGEKVFMLPMYNANTTMQVHQWVYDSVGNTLTHSVPISSVQCYPYLNSESCVHTRGDRAGWYMKVNDGYLIPTQAFTNWHRIAVNVDGTFAALTNVTEDSSGAAGYYSNSGHCMELSPNYYLMTNSALSGFTYMDYTAQDTIVFTSEVMDGRAVPLKNSSYVSSTFDEDTRTLYAINPYNFITIPFIGDVPDFDNLTRESDLLQPSWGVGRSHSFLGKKLICGHGRIAAYFSNYHACVFAFSIRDLTRGKRHGSLGYAVSNADVTDETVDVILTSDFFDTSAEIPTGTLFPPANRYTQGLVAIAPTTLASSSYSLPRFKATNVAGLTDAGLPVLPRYNNAKVQFKGFGSINLSITGYHADYRTSMVWMVDGYAYLANDVTNNAMHLTAEMVSDVNLYIVAQAGVSAAMNVDYTLTAYNSYVRADYEYMENHT